MAFVINKSQLKSVFDTININPGPGAYSLSQKEIQQRPAPFNSSVYKQSCFATQQSKLGPGSYAKTSIVQCFNTKNACGSSFKSKVKRPSLVNKNQLQYSDSGYKTQSQKSLLNCKPQSRLKTQQHQRQTILKQKKQNINKLRKQNHSRKVNSIVQPTKQAVRVVLSNPRNTQYVDSFYVDHNASVDYTNGPGQYQVAKPFVQKNKSVIDWSKYKQRRFRYKTHHYQIPGPGQYELQNKGKLRQTRSTSSFSYDGMRSYMDTIIYKTNNKIKAKIMQAKKIKDKTPGPADYSPQKIGKDSHYYGKQIFGTTVERFNTQKQKVIIPGPGYYANMDCKYKYEGIVKQVRNKIFGKKNPLVSTYHQDQFVPLQKQLRNRTLNAQVQQQTIVQCPLKYRCHSKIGSISRQQRFKNVSTTKLPGPGQYYSTKKQKNNPEMSGIFKSNVQRNPYPSNNKQLDLPFYEINKNDIAYKTQKKRQNIQNLKTVAIQKPPFDSNAQRFTIKRQQFAPDDGRIKQQIQKIISQDQIEYHSFKPYKQKPKYASVFRSNTKRDPYVITQNPGPGAYQYGDIINKKSFNAQYLGLRRRLSKQKASSMSNLQIR